MDIQKEKDDIIENAASLAFLNVLWFNRLKEILLENIHEEDDQTLFGLLDHAKAENKELFERIKQLNKMKKEEKNETT